jgi:hypothetical protein
MAQYGNVAIGVVNKFLSSANPAMLDPRQEWRNIANSLISSQSSIVKCCPRNAFLGLCENGLVSGIPPGQYTKSQSNKNYAVEAVKLLKNNSGYSALSSKKLWEIVMLSLGLAVTKRHNNQMDVVLALWNANYII